MKVPYKFIGAAFLATILFTSQACKENCLQGSGNEKTDKRQLTAFSQLEITGSFNVTLVQDSSNAVTITADDNIVSVIKTDVSGDKLKISSDKKNLCSTKEIAITIGVRNLKAISASGAIDMASRGHLNLGDLDIDLAGATKLNLDVTAANIETEASGVNEITLKGQARSHKIEFSGSGNLKAFDLVTGNYNIESSGQSDCEINVLNELNIHTTGASEIKYKGTPTKINKSKTGALTLTKTD
ncbi:head GIN domain-containing protein [Mucilaginibacter auburnensis]|uniref:Putative autotransporter adhesin-like protein n=1 Tax=Mucilaginibacter auburnensis TaxID=1457233 RepID=A0A2H9VM64_9SPHI|nr:head GIN domain-containing protein [Mucilaginibacter auburnensis]PJJ79395.1 putative autotransporter adhesin-like protein [Mucilaginibacter auburnensis]